MSWWPGMHELKSGCIACILTILFLDSAATAWSSDWRMSIAWACMSCEPVWQETMHECLGKAGVISHYPLLRLTSWFVCLSWGCWHASAYCSNSLSISSVLLYWTSLPSELNMIKATLQSHKTLSFIASRRRFFFLLLYVTCDNKVAYNCDYTVRFFWDYQLYIRNAIRDPRASAKDHEVFGPETKSSRCDVDNKLLLNRQWITLDDALLSYRLITIPHTRVNVQLCSTLHMHLLWCSPSCDQMTINAMYCAWARAQPHLAVHT